MSRRVTSTNDDGINIMYMRYAEVLLLAAEAANQLEGPASAASYLKEIRKRAFPSELQAEKVDNYVSALTSKEAMFNAIVKENLYEFTGEMLRKQSLIRWNLLGTNIDLAKQKMTNLINRTGEYTDVPTTLYYKYADDGETLVIYGLNRGETNDPGVEYSAKGWTNLTSERVEAIYVNDPDTKQFWPIWQTFIDNSNGLLVNDYDY
jgi:hypothetical protein